jgi:heme A synthase
MLIVFFPVLGYDANLDLHMLGGVVVVVLALIVYRQVRKTSCPDRIKRIARSTAQLAVLDAVIGVPLYLTDMSILGVPFKEVILFLHFVLAITIIAQASSSATAYDMWEEREFAPTPSDQPRSPAHTS